MGIYYSINDTQALPKVSEEARLFISNLPSSFVEAQKQALTEAICGDYQKLNEIRLGRIVPISDRKDVFYLLSDINFGAEKHKLYVFIPKNIREKLNVIIYYHGGGWCINAPESCSRFCQDIAVSTGSIVVCPEYRLAPEAKYPASNLDAISTVEWVKKNIPNVAKIFLAGDSAGGHLVAATALYFKEKIDGAIMFYPATDLSLETDRKSWRDFAKGYCLNADLMKLFIEAYLSDSTIAKNQNASPIFAKDLKNFPNSLIISAQCDILRDEALDFALKLKDFGVNIRYRCLEGATHLFITKEGLDNAYSLALKEATEFVLRNAE